MADQSYGRLVINTYTGSGAIPVPSATVRIRGSDESNRFIEYSVLTDEDGISPTVNLPAPDISYSLTQNPSESPFSSYDIEIMKDGYYTKKIFISRKVNLKQKKRLVTLLLLLILKYRHYQNCNDNQRQNICKIRSEPFCNFQASS